MQPHSTMVSYLLECLGLRNLLILLSQTSKSRAAQESLAGLEKASAPFETKLEEAWKFIGSESGHSRRPANQDAEPAVKYSAFHGREEWLLRWLLKNLQSPKDASPRLDNSSVLFVPTNIDRQTPSSWNLLHHLIQSIPITNAAQILSERKFISTLRRTLEEAKGLIEDSLTTNQPIELDSESSSTTKSSKTTPSKKRKRTEEEDKVENRNLDKSLLPAISKAVNYISASAKTTSDAPDDSQNGAFSAEYMKTVLITTAEESAKILGSWLALYSKEVPISLTVTETLTSPFVEIWELHTAGSEDLMQFSLHCLQPLLAVLRKGSQGGSEGDRFLQLEQLVARYIMIPSRTANTENAESELLETLTKIPVILSSVHASILFDIAINSLQPTKFLRRRPQDHAWLQTAFTVLKDSMPPKRLTGNRQAIQRMLQSARDSKVSFELPILRSVTLQYALLGDSTDWNLLSTIIKLDANTLLIPNKEKDLTQEVFTRVTAACIEPTWSELYQIVTDVVITLMNEFSKARDLSGFIRHWYAQLVEFERRRKEAFLFSMSLFSAWEDDTLQSELAKLLEPSLTVQQIVQLLEWLSAEVKINPNAVCVILEAISGAIKREEVIDAVGLRIYHIMFDDKGPEKLDGRYQWRSWRLLSRMLEWTQENELEEIPQLWLEKKRPFDSLQGKTSVGGLLEIDAENTVSLETLEALRLSCTLYSTAEDGSQLKILAGKPLLNLLQRLAYDIKAFPHDLQSDQELGQEVCGSNLNTLYRGAGWMMWSFVRCVLVEYPQVLL
jgi:nucleolar pre-ribosomal-associated protein 2